MHSFRLTVCVVVFVSFSSVCLWSTAGSHGECAKPLRKDKETQEKTAPPIISQILVAILIFICAIAKKANLLSRKSGQKSGRRRKWRKERKNNAKIISAGAFLPFAYERYLPQHADEAQYFSGRRLCFLIKDALEMEIGWLRVGVERRAGGVVPVTAVWMVLLLNTRLKWAVLEAISVQIDVDLT